MTPGQTTVPNTFTTTPGVVPTTTATDMPTTPYPTPTDTQTSCYEEVIVISCGDGTETYPPDVAMLQCGVSGLVPHNGYVVEVFAATAPGAGDKESSTESTMQDRPCDPPTDIVVSNTSSSSPDPNTKSVNVTWTPPTQPNGDVIFSSYTVTVAAYTAVGYGPESEEVMFVTEEGVPSTSITDLQANLSATAVSLKWTPPSDPNGIIQVYEVHYNDTVDGNYTVVNTTGPEPSIVLGGLEEYWEYMVWIYTYTRMGRGSIYSTPYTLQTEEAVPGPPPISSTITTSRSIAVQWGPPSKYQQNGILQGYYLSYNTTSAGPNFLSFNSSVESYTIHGLTPYMNYTLCLWAWNSAGNGSRSCVMEETEQDVPSAPLNLALNEVLPRSITLKWDSPAETNGIILGYTIMYTMEGAPDSQEVEATETTGQISDLRAHTGYRIQVAARTVIGQGAKSEPFNATTSIAIPSKPQNVEGTAVNQSAIYVEWEEPQPYPGPTTYAVLVHDAVDDTQQSTFQAGGMTSWTVLGLKAYSSYYFVIMAMTDAGETNSDPSESITTLPGAPVVDQDIKPQDGSVSTTTTLTVTFTSAMFSEENGPVAAYTVFVAQDTEDLSDSPSSGHENDTTVLTWYDVQNRDPVPPYQVTEKLEYPFASGSRSKRQASESHEFVIGEEKECEPRRDFCNGPLKPGTTYRAKLRAFTENGWYADSSYSEPLKTTGETQPPRPMALAIGVGTAGGVVLLILIILTAVVCLKQRRSRRQEMVVVPPQALLDIHLPASEQQMVETSSRPIYKTEFVEHMEKMSEENQYWMEDEYSSLRHVGRDQRITAAHLSVNSSKNRYTNILPYDHSRVELHPLEEDENSDYINANYIPGYRYEREFIATQGPVPFTVPDFWRMVWEQNSRVLVMLTQCWERGKPKCERYWPEDEEPVFYGDIVVKMLSENTEDDWTCREFELANNSHSRCVRQYQFTSWPDHGVPEDTSASLQFVRMVRRNIGESAGPTVVHCRACAKHWSKKLSSMTAVSSRRISAGVGRTGTFIALDRLLQHMEDHEQVDIFGIVHQMRMYRVFMVQTQEQYIFIHQCIMDLLQESTPVKRRSTIKRVQFAEAEDEEVDLDDINFAESTEYLVAPDANSAL
ncbi:hypothetical protein Bbelb_333360 [Branchiostoma belcheri]|nr:hypothetical protein Bbelb_333360 [Branchiostoma belcheri]